MEYPGSHEPLISKTLFDKVQQVLQAHAHSGEKRRTHHHYLVGSVFCKQCGSRLGIMNAKNRYGTVYPYFFCLGRQEKRTGCIQRTVRIEAVEDKIIELWERERLTAIQRDELETFVRSELRTLDERNANERTRQQLRIDQLKSERQKLLQAHYADALPLELMKSEQQRIASDLRNAEEYELLLDPTIREIAHETQNDRTDVVEGVTIPTREAHVKICTASRRRKTRTPTFAGRGSRIDWLVGEGGLEPPHSCLY